MSEALGAVTGVVLTVLLITGVFWAIGNMGEATYERGRVRGYCEGAGGEVTRSHGGWYCRGADGRVLVTR